MTENEVPFYLIQTLYSLRIKYGMTTIELAENLGVSVDQYMNWEKDSSNIPYSHILKLETIFKTPAKYIFFGSDITFSNKEDLNEE